MPPLATVREANAKFAPPYTPVALFVGATSGIGQSMAQAFARYTKGNAHIIICGRNRARAEAIIASFPKPTIPEGAQQPVHEFVYCDATLMKNVHAMTTDLLARLPKINFLVLSPGYLSLKGLDPTEEGIGRQLALNYYARWKYIDELMPLLRSAKDAGEDAKVFSVLAAGDGQEMDMDDIDLKNTFGFVKNLKIAPTYNDLMMEEFAIRQPDIAFTHVHPGGVRTNLLWPKRWVLVPFAFLLLLALYPTTVSKEVCAEHMLWALFDGEKGVFRRGPKGDDIGKTKYFGTEEERKGLWVHTVAKFKALESQAVVS